jgi:hypothetical protein
MAKAKSLGADAPEQTSVETKKSNPSLDLKRAVNAGVPVTLSIGEYVVKEMDGADFLVFLLDSVDAVQGIFSDGESTFESLKSFVRDPEKRKQIDYFFEKSIGVEEGYLATNPLKPTDYVKLLVASRQAYDWETLSTGFSELGLTGILQQTFLSSQEK